MRYITSLHQKHAPIHLGRMKHIVRGGLVTNSKKLSPEQYAMVVDSSQSISEGSGVRTKKLKPLKFRI